MDYTPPYQYQWQNPELVKTIYPFRLQKLRDFLLYYKEIDLWKTFRNTVVDQNTSMEVIQEISGMNLQINDAKKALVDAKGKITELEKKNRQALNDRNVLLLEQTRSNLKAKLPRQTSTIRALNDSVQWYQNYAKNHPEVLDSPAYKRRLDDLKAAQDGYQAILQGIDKATADQQAVLAKLGFGTLESDRQQLLQQIQDLTDNVNRLTAEINLLPPIAKNGEVTPTTLVRWKVRNYEKQLLDLDQVRLVAEIIKRFDAEPNRFPKWLQYMVLHFSGMRYKSAHGSWADPRDLLENVKLEEFEKWVTKTAAPADLDQECAKAVQALEGSKVNASAADQERIKWQIISLTDKFNRQAALIKYKSPLISIEVRSMNDGQVLASLQSMKDIFPPWVWKEIVSRTDLRLQTTDPDWENLSPEERQQRWEWKSGYWREIMQSWEGKDITGWRKENEMTLALVVTRAVCNEIAEHIQHLRGRSPTGGLTAKPIWYLSEQNAARSKPPQTPLADPPFFKLPGQQKKEDYKPGASILWLGWVYQRPDPWQITHPIEGVNTLPPRDTLSSSSWNYHMEGSEFVREAKISNQLAKNWLRWTHEATVVEVVEMAGGVETVITFETGQIGLRLRTLRELLNNAYIYIGYVPPAPFEAENLEKMIARNTLLPAGITPAAREIAFATPEAEITIPTPQFETKLQIWQTLSKRERQVVTLICAGKTISEIAGRLEIKPNTVKKHLQNAMHMFGVHSRVELRQVIAEIRSTS
jgi:DNA-binding CsgD family transcriptional regulator